MYVCMWHFVSVLSLLFVLLLLTFVVVKVRGLGFVVDRKTEARADILFLVPNLTRTLTLTLAAIVGSCCRPVTNLTPVRHTPRVCTPFPLTLCRDFSWRGVYRQP